MESERLKTTGNQHYKAGHLVAAVDAYERAYQLSSNPQAPTYLSNLSAAYYELGDYEHALEAIDRAFEQLHAVTPDDPSVASLDLRLRLRECRCLLQMQEFDQLLDAIQEVAQAVYDEHVEFGVIEDAALHSLDQLSVWASTKANKFVTSLPRRRPQTRSKRKARNGMTRDKRPATSFFLVPGMPGLAVPRDKVLKIENLQWFSVFCGNVDARHVLATVTDMYDQNKDGVFSLQMLLMEEDPSIVARNTILYFLIDELSRLPLEAPDQATIELLTLLHYTYVGAMMPLWVHERLLSTIRVVSTRLCSGQGIPPWLDFSLETIDQIMPVFKYWTGAAVDQVSIAQCMEMQKSAAGPMDETPQTPAGKQRTAELRKQARSDIQVAIQNFSADQLDQILAKSCNTLATMSLKGKRELALKLFATDEALDSLNRKLYVPEGLLMEYSTYYQLGLKMLYMPSEVHHREPKLMEHVTKLWSIWVKADRASGKEAKTQHAPQAAATATLATDYLQSHWKTNVTLLPLDGEPDLSFDPFAVTQLAMVNEPRLVKPLWLYDYTSHWFTRVARAIRACGPVCYFECRIGEPHHALEQVARSEEGRFDLFDRIYFAEDASEHGGFLAQVFDGYQNLNSGDHVFLATRMPDVKQADVARVVLDGTALPDFAAVQRYLGLVPLGPLAPTDLRGAEYLRWQPVPGTAPLVGASRIGEPDGLKREQLTDWLYQVFLTLALPRKRPARAKSGPPTEPLNLHAFFRLLLYLQAIGLPGHWLGQVVDNLIQHRVVTRARPLAAWQEPVASGPAQSAVPPSTAAGCVSATAASKAICVMPFALEMEAALCVWFPLLTFGITCVDFPDANGVKLYTVKLGPPTQAISTAGGDADETAPLALWFSQTNKRALGADLSRDLVGSHAAAPGIRLVSSFNWDPVERQASFLCWSLSMDWLIAQNWHVRLVRTGWWDTASAVVSVKMCKAGVALSEYQEPL